MSSIQGKLEKVLLLIRDNSNLIHAKDLETATSKLEASLSLFIEKAESFNVEKTEGYAEAAVLLEEFGKYSSLYRFMNSFAKANFEEPFNVKAATKVNKQRFLQITAREKKLEKLRQEIDPFEKSRADFDNLILLPIAQIEQKLRDFNNQRLTAICKANSLPYDATPTGLASKKTSSMRKILSEIEKVKLTQHY